MLDLADSTAVADRAARPAPLPIPTAVPTPGTPAWWAAHREAVALVAEWEAPSEDPWEEIDKLRRIMAHGMAMRMMTALGHRVARWVRDLERDWVECDRDDDSFLGWDADENDDDASTTPP